MQTYLHIQSDQKYFVRTVTLYLIQNSPAVKKVCVPKKATLKIDVKSEAVAKK